MHVAIGDTVDAVTGFDPQLRTYVGRRKLVLVGQGRFFYTSAEQPVAAVPLATVQAMGGPQRAGRVSLVLARVRDSANADSAAAWVDRAIPRVTTISTDAALRQVDERMGYFRQLAVILAAVGLVVGFLLVTTLVTVSVNERLGEIAVMRAIGVRRGRIVQQIVLEGVALSLIGALGGLGLGLVTARYLNAILSDFPGLPSTFHFFLFQPVAAVRSLGLLVVGKHTRRGVPRMACSVAADHAGTLRRGSHAHDGDRHPARLRACDSWRGADRAPGPRRLSRLSVGQETVHALRGVSIEIARGDYAAIIGPSGCGKSTLLNLLGVVDRPTRGQVLIEGWDSGAMRDREATDFRLRHIGFVFQRFYLMAMLTARGECGAADSGGRGGVRRACGACPGAARLRGTRGARAASAGKPVGG